MKKQETLALVKKKNINGFCENASSFPLLFLFPHQEKDSKR